jgi:phosphatidylserine/phosphatidylglycerophosphate/cardiolipin synthase-like enzyme
VPFRRLLVVLDASLDAEPVLRAAARVAPRASHVEVCALIEEDHAAASRAGLGLGNLERVREVLRDGAGDGPPAEPTAPLTVVLGTAFDRDRLADAARRARAELVVVGPWAAHSARERVLSILELASSAGVHVLSVGARVGAGGDVVRVAGLVVDADGAGLASATALVRELTDVAHVVAFAVLPTPERGEELAVTLRALLGTRTVEVVGLEASLTTRAAQVEAEAAARGVELVVTASDGVSALSALVTGLWAADVVADARHPLLVVRRSAVAPTLWVERLVSSDVLLLPSGPRPLVVERVGVLGKVPLGAAEQFTPAGTTMSTPLVPDGGVLWLDMPLEPGALALVSSGQDVVTCRVVQPTGALLVLDAALEPEAYHELAALGRERTVVAVRLRASEHLQAVRERLVRDAPWAEAPLLIDASAWLDDGGAEDVPRAVDAQRLVRVAARLVECGARVAAVVTRAAHHASAPGLRVLDVPLELPEGAVEAPALALAPPRATTPPRATLDRLAAATGASCVDGHDVVFELDNAAARAGVLEALAAATSRVHWQCYIVEDDAVSTELADALAAAARRGVVVRVLVDAFYSLHDAFGTTNPVLARLGQVPGVEVRAYQPISGVPSLAELKQRNHRKLVVVDGRVAHVSGRNLGAPYYLGFDEVTIGPASSYRQLPWLDASVRLEGPLVAEVDRTFRADWVRAGGATFEVHEVPPAGAVGCRWVVHEGLVDTQTLEAQRVLIDDARRSLLLVNTFPLLVELQRCLVRAVRRGVAVRVLFGSVRPRYGADVPFPGGTLRALGDELVRSRLDPVLRAGGQAFELAMPPRRGWDPALEVVYPHVHAKLLLVDEEVVAVGSANVDVTSAYWESEALLIVHDVGFAARTAAELEPWLATARRVDPGEGSWGRDAARRAWLGRNWPSLIG